jgi:hypothetical protein
LEIVLMSGGNETNNLALKVFRLICRPAGTTSSQPASSIPP